MKKTINASELRLRPIPKLKEESGIHCDSFRGAYVGRLAAIDYSDGILTGIFGGAHISVKMEKLPEWIFEGCTVTIDFSGEGLVICPFEPQNKKGQPG